MIFIQELHRIVRASLGGTSRPRAEVAATSSPIGDFVPECVDPALLPTIGRAVEASHWLPRLPSELTVAFAASQNQIRRPTNRVVIAILTIVFDLFWLAQFQSAPELVPLSGVLRLAVFSPCVLLFLFLDRLDKLRNGYDFALLALAIAPNAISAVLCVETTSLTSLADIRATPLILLTTGLIWRMPPAAVMVNAAVSTCAFACGVYLSPGVPKAELGSLILTDVAIGLAVSVFSLQLEARDRRVFLLNAAERIQRRELALRNLGLRKEAQTDALTGVCNRRFFDEQLAMAWRACLQNGQPISLIMIDIDHFKRFNDHYGHQGGDDCLRRVATEIQRLLRPGDLIARYGGEEFAVIPREQALGAAALVAERIRAGVEALALPHAGIGLDSVVTISLGVATMTPTDAQGARRLVEKADNCLYAAKRDGRNRLGFEVRSRPIEWDRDAEPEIPALHARVRKTGANR